MCMIENMDEKYNGITTYKIGDVAKRADVNKETVRYYEKRDLIPKPDRRRSGYRIFTQRHIDQIRFIKRAQQLGFTLSEIKELLELRMNANTTCPEIKSEAQEKYRDVREKIEDLRRIQKTLTDLIDSCSEEGPVGDCPILEALEGKNETGKQLRK
ncbi:MerR family transcriptional regulator, mercuric resistance operon regulatory protein [Fodinibius salinus]|uniref:MerR family transcriptional regulator, mercuric resistance operon regulatory protein n=1 Tax=Fodinibius salinus TaxID=860790 RepID=A0A5D3YJC3_9BACT|nr:MerR family transcriptional regulator, mercuric resistance operon regulatory protein [Fodinibius salinus]